MEDLELLEDLEMLEDLDTGAIGNPECQKTEDVEIEPAVGRPG